MRQISGHDRIIDRLVKGHDEIIYNLFYVIRSGENAFIVTDDRSYILAQSNPNTPIWIYCNNKMDHTSECELVRLLCERSELNNNVHIVAQAERIANVFEQVADIMGIQFEEYMPMSVYACHQVNIINEEGERVMPNAQYVKQIAELAIQQTWDAEHIELAYVDAFGFAEGNKDSKNLFLWKNENIVAMARVAHKNEKYARINTVVTERSQRGKGYARMLVGSISKDLLNEGIIPMLYADTNNPSSNSAYLKIGFEKVGEIVEFQIK